MLKYILLNFLLISFLRYSLCSFIPCLIVCPFICKLSMKRKTTLQPSNPSLELLPSWFKISILKIMRVLENCFAEQRRPQLRLKYSIGLISLKPQGIKLRIVLKYLGLCTLVGNSSSKQWFVNVQFVSLCSLEAGH